MPDQKRQCLDNIQNIQTPFRCFPFLPDNFKLSLEPYMPALGLLCLGVSTYILCQQSSQFYNITDFKSSWNSRVGPKYGSILSSFSNAWIPSKCKPQLVFIQQYLFISFIILWTVHSIPCSPLLWLPVTTHLPLPGFHSSWIRCDGFLQRLPWFSPRVVVVFFNLQKQSQLLLCPTQVELGLSIQIGDQQLKTF